MMPHSDKSHIDKGQLHAYLDGALDEYPTAEAHHVREHLELCQACRDRLQAEQAVLDRATEILNVSTPAIDMPALEELRAQARVRKATGVRSSTRLHRLGWAASVVLALGAGWMLRGGPVGEVALDTAPGVAPALAVDEGEPVSTLATDASDVGAVPGAAGSVLAGGSTAETAVADGSGGSGELLSLPDEATASPIDAIVLEGLVASRRTVPIDLGASRPEPLRAIPLDATAVSVAGLVADAGTPSLEREAGRSDSDAPDSIVERERPASPREVLTSANRVAEPSGLGVVGRPSEDVRDERVDEEGSYSLVVPGLEVLDVRFRGEVRPEGQVVLQRLASGDVLEVIHLPAEISPASLAEADPDDRQLVLQTASGWIVMRAPVTEEELMELMRRLLSED